MNPDTSFRSVMQTLQWPAVPTPMAANKLALLFQIELGQWRPQAEIATAQIDQVRRLLAFSARTVPLYRRIFGVDFAARSLTNADWEGVPLLTRRMLHDLPEELRSESIPKGHGRTFPIRTSGSTGMMVEVLGTDLTSLFWQVYCLRDHLWHRRDLRGKLCTIRYQRNPQAKGPEGFRASGWGVATDDVAITGPSINYDILLDVAHLSERLLADAPDYVLGHPSVLAEMARYCLGRGLRPAGLKEVRTMGETPDDSLRGMCEQAWGARVTDIYSCQEVGYLAIQCPDHPVLHVQSENVLIEVLDESGRPAGPGEVGRVVVTCLNNFATPLIRYEVGDYAEVGEACPCGRGLPVLRRVLGRYRNLLTLPDGTRRWPRIGYESQLQAAAPIELMQMIQTDRESITVRLVAPRQLLDVELSSLSGFIHEKLGHPFRLKFEYAETIRNPANGKIEQFISLVES